MTTSNLKSELWAGVLSRLRQGEPLVTPKDFEDALEAEFRERTGTPLPDEIRTQLHELVVELHTQHPETYLAWGLQNAVRRAFEVGIDRMSWSRDTVERRGWQVIQRFLRSEQMRDLFADIRLSPDAIDVSRCVRQIIDSLDAGAAVPAQLHLEEEAVIDTAPAANPRAVSHHVQ